MELVEQNYDQAIQNIIKVYIAQMNSAMKNINNASYNQIDKKNLLLIY